MSEERLIRVEKFEELKAGMLVVYRPCTVCFESHRTMLLKRSDKEGPCAATGEMVDERGWRILPSPSCRDDPPESDLTEAAVARGAVYRIVEANPQVETTEAETARPKKRERVAAR